MDSQLNIVGLVRAKNEGRWIRKCVTSMLACCRDVVVLDDNSSDNTDVEAIEAGATLLLSPFNTFNEARDKNHLLAQVMSGTIVDPPAWCLMLDGDEELAPGAADKILQTVAGNETIRAGGATPADSYRVKFIYLWDRPDQKRIDRWYEGFTRASLWRCAPGQKFGPGNAASLHCGSTPAGLREQSIPIADVLHYGYMLRADRIRKYEYYNAIDPHNEFEDGYKHMVIGDILPASYAGKWAGPLQLAPL